MGIYKKKSLEYLHFLSLLLQEKMNLNSSVWCPLDNWNLGDVLWNLDVNLKLIQVFWVQKLDWKSFKSRLSHEISITSILTDKPQVSEKPPFVCYLWILHHKRKVQEKDGTCFDSSFTGEFQSIRICLKPLYSNSLKSLLDTSMMLPSV